MKATAASVLTYNVLFVSLWCLCVSDGACVSVVVLLVGFSRLAGGKGSYLLRAYHLTSAKDSDLFRGACHDPCAKRASAEAYNKTFVRFVSCGRARAHCAARRVS
ncbi:hypothetical protein PF005_g6382 [Phytophthora fragariae]|uniref:Uncharacterized protein n=1 Tax=Phytophthora fragariae TaxID=53985 RepID=A0A6A3ZVX5_9STRA|nr:hypothetical protein PF003_g33184 [Phytophthora fragariae]KAE8943292.1 hypothetical protein PF009_g6981 [Phytophthora fragariae]KAE9020004.1 hypothetical protein PF011_g5597 [Phytophthora fragariae]KAE9124967.1 hypothetical protein PF007_g6528 [Phytophthora fragariae]KAE9149662.1 hypothetical protein PF006_g5868 [Phytophthora fragariae]